MPSKRSVQVPEGFVPRKARWDVALADLFPEFSRTHLQRWLDEGRVSVDGAPVVPRETPLPDTGQQVEITVPDPRAIEVVAR